MSEHHYILGTQRSELQFQGTGFTNSCEPLCRYWELNPDLLEKQLASGLTTKLYLQPPSCYYFFLKWKLNLGTYTFLVSVLPLITLTLYFKTGSGYKAQAGLNLLILLL